MVLGCIINFLTKINLLPPGNFKHIFMSVKVKVNKYQFLIVFATFWKRKLGPDFVLRSCCVVPKQVWNVSNNNRLDKFDTTCVYTRVCTVFKAEVKIKSPNTTFRYVCLNLSCLKRVFWKTFIHMPHLFDLWGESRETAYTLLTFVQSLIKFQSVVLEIQMKRAKRDILSYRMTNQVIESA